MGLGQFYQEKNQKMHRETASEMVSLPWSQNNQKKNVARSYKGKYTIQYNILYLTKVT